MHIPYRGAAPATTALLAGDVSMLLLNLSSIEAHEKTGKARILAAAGDKRAALRPDLPTVAEAGVPGFATTAWFALWGPANMAPDLVAKIHADVGKVLDLPQSREFFRTNSFERVDLVAGAVRQADRGRFQALGRAGQGGRRQARLSEAKSRVPCPRLEDRAAACR